jgi:hypothetical protein
MNDNKPSFKKLINELIDFGELKINTILESLSGIGSLLLENIFVITVGIHTYAKAIEVLAKDDNIAAGNVLLRSIFEGLVNIKYILKDKTQLRAASFELNDLDKQNKFVKGILNGPEDIGLITNKTQLSEIESCKKRLEEIENRKAEIITIFKDTYNIKIQNSEKINWETDVFKKSKEVGLESEYRTIYTYLCGFSHLDATGLKTFFQLGDGKYHINIKKSEDEIESLLGATCSYYLKTLREICVNFNIYSEKEFSQFLDTFKILNK